MRHPAMDQGSFAPLSAKGALAFADIVGAALAEDAAGTDITSVATIDPTARARAQIVSRANAVIAGLPIAGLTFREVDATTAFDELTEDGRLVAAGPIARVSGSARSLLAAERVALNFLGHLSGIASLTQRYVELVRDLPVRICDTRKTTPGLRALERYAVRAGGGYNHRFDLSDAVLIKDNHLAASGSVTQAIARARAATPGGTIVEVECESVRQVAEAVAGAADAILLDNMDLADLRAAVELARGKALLEASGGVTLGNVRAIALTGVDIISVGALTHSAPAADVALDFVLAAE